MSEFSNHIRIFPTMSELFLPFSHFYRGIFPTMSEFFHIPTLSPGKNPLLADGRDPGLSHAKKTAVVGSKNIPLTAQGIIRRM
jgi:hypothetical protein